MKSDSLRKIIYIVFILTVISNYNLVFLFGLNWLVNILILIFYVTNTIYITRKLATIVVIFLYSTVL